MLSILVGDIPMMGTQFSIMISYKQTRSLLWLVDIPMIKTSEKRGCPKIGLPPNSSISRWGVPLETVQLLGF